MVRTDFNNVRNNEVLDERASQRNNIEIPRYNVRQLAQYSIPLFESNPCFSC